MTPTEREETPYEGLDFTCSICEAGNGGQVCEACHDRIPAFKRWLVATEVLPKARTRFLIVHRLKRNTLEPLPASTIFYSDREDAQERLDDMGSDAERYEIREIKVALL